MTNAVTEGSSYGEAAYRAETVAKNGMPLHDTLLETHGALMDAMGKKESGGFDVVAVNDGAYVTTDDGEWTSYELELDAIALSELNDAFAENGLDTEVVFVSSQPQIINGYTEALESYPLPDQSLMMETILYHLRSYGVDFMDSQSVLGKSSLQPSEYVFKTDTKPTIQASFIMAKAFANQLHSDYGKNSADLYNLYKESDFSYTTYENILLGNIGMRAGEHFTGREDLTLIAPKYETSMTYTSVLPEEESVTGSFEEVLFDLDHLEPLDPYQYSAYSVYMGGGASYLRVITNDDLKDAPNVLLIHDASGLPFGAYLSLGLSETHMYWPAQDPAGDFDIVAYAKEHDIDYVCFMSENSIYALREVTQIADQ